MTPIAPSSLRRFGPTIGCWALLIGVVLLIIGALGYTGAHLLPRIFGGSDTHVTHDVVIQQMRSVAKLVSTEATVRDVVVYENTWFGSTKHSLVVVTGRLLAGIDLEDNPEVAIDHKAREITIRIAPAKLIAVEILDMKTYDERGGLWNPFGPDDRNMIQQQVRTQLVAAGREMELLRHANESAIRILTALLSRDGYTVHVAIRGTLAVPAAH